SREELQGVDVACLSDEDLLGQGDLLQRLCSAVPIVALTHERKGCDIIENTGRTWVGIHPAEETDPTGAGDTFAAGLLFGLAQGRSPQEAARLGAACASIIIEGVAGENFSRMEDAFARADQIENRSF
ncbi:carbohydrate kinase family protein, partial [Myxococcota bacterium]